MHDDRYQPTSNNSNSVDLKKNFMTKYSHFITCICKIFMYIFQFISLSYRGIQLIKPFLFVFCRLIPAIVVLFSDFLPDFYLIKCRFWSRSGWKGSNIQTRKYQVNKSIQRRNNLPSICMKTYYIQSNDRE